MFPLLKPTLKITIKNGAATAATKTSTINHVKRKFVYAFSLWLTTHTNSSFHVCVFFFNWHVDDVDDHFDDDDDVVEAVTVDCDDDTNTYIYICTYI